MLTESSAELFLAAYRQGIFPMAENADDLHYNFYAPDMRAQLPILNLHIPRKLLKTLKQNPFEIKIDTAFKDVILACGDQYKDRDTTWINPLIRDAFIDLHKQGHAHSVECWQDNKLVGGLYGIAIGQVFCGESMFSRTTDASKIALIHLCARLHIGSFTTLDTQFVNDHLKQFGIYEIPQEEYETLIQTEMNKPANFSLDNLKPSEILEKYLNARR